MTNEMKYPLNLSLSDLLLVDGFKEAFSNNDKKEIDRILYSCGMDVGHEYEVKECIHRNLRSQKVHCEYFFGFMRTDKEWTKHLTGFDLAMVESDSSMRNILLTSSRQGFSGSAYAEIVERSDESENSQKKKRGKK